MEYIDALYCFRKMIAEDFGAFVEQTKQKGLDEGRLKYADTMMHLAKNLDKEIFVEEGIDLDAEFDAQKKSSGSTQGYGRAIRTTPGIGEGQSGRGRSMKGAEPHTAYTAYTGGDGTSGKRDSMGRYSGMIENDMFSRMQKMADMTPNHDEREIIMRMIERLKQDSNE